MDMNIFLNFLLTAADGDAHWHLQPVHPAFRSGVLLFLPYLNDGTFTAGQAAAHNSHFISYSVLVFYTAH